MIPTYVKTRSLIFVILSILFCNPDIQAGTPVVSGVFPPNWWTGMKEEKLEIIFHGDNIQQWSISMKASNAVITSVTKPPNKNYVFVEVSISPQQEPGELVFQFSGKKKIKAEYRYQLLKREEIGRSRGISSEDLIYLLFPDRFANGDLNNDSFSGMKENTVDRTGLKSRHGGDLQGIMDHLNYLEELGVTALWINPVIENDQPYESYHGYAVTDPYKIDPRFGTNEMYKALCRACHDKGIKMIWDVVYNHWGNEHLMFRDIPDSNWVHWFPEFTRTSYRAEVLLDPYASQHDKKLMTDAWFDKHMPDLNQQDPHLAKYLIQNSIWWIEYAGLDAFRIDTYAYPDQQFMKKLNESVLREYPDFVLFGETWVQGSPVQAWFTEDVYLKKDYSSSLTGVTDFQLYYAINKGLTENFGWEEGFRRIELTLSHDLLYKHPQKLVTFLDNHDLSRYYSMVREDLQLYKMGIGLLYTLRGIPSIYYGTEILMKNFADPDAKVREDFPGGWPSDKTSKFNADGRSESENEAFRFCSALGTWRRNNRWMGNSKLTQFVPENNTYVYFRHDENHTLMCVYNGNDTATSIAMNRFRECTGKYNKARNIIDGQEITLGTSMELPPKSVMLLQLQ